MADAIKNLGLLALIESAIIRRQIASHTTELGDVLSAAFRAFRIELGLKTTVVAGVDGEIEGEVRNVQRLHGVIDDVLNGLRIGHQRRITLDVGDRATGAELCKGGFDTELFINPNLFPDGNMVGVGQIIPVGHTGDNAVLGTEGIQRGMAIVFGRSGITAGVQTIPLTEFLGISMDAFHYAEGKLSRLLAADVVLTKQSLAHFGNADISEGKCAMLERLKNIILALVRTLDRAVVIHERRGGGVLRTKDIKPLEVGAFRQGEGRFEGRPKTFEVGLAALPKADAVLDAKLGEADGNGDIVAASNADVAKTIAVVADHGTATHRSKNCIRVVWVFMSFRPIAIADVHETPAFPRGADYIFTRMTAGTLHFAVETFT